MNEDKGKLLKRKKQPGEFGIDNIDNTAAVKKILNDLQAQNSKAFAFYCQTLRPRRTIHRRNLNLHFTVTGHPLNAFGDDWDGDLKSGYFEEFNYRSLMPSFVTSMVNLEKSDPVTAYMKLKNDWKRNTRNLRVAAASSSLMKKYERFNEDVVQCPKHFVDMAAHLDSDPDPYFDCSYNWYYAGNGNLQLICVDWVDYLLHSEFNTMYLTQFTQNDLILNKDYAATFNCGEGFNILETICSTHNVIALRTKYKVFILKIVNAIDKLEIQKVKAMESNFPFTNISFDKHHKNILYVTSLDNKLTIVNLDRLKGRSVKLKSKIDSLVDNWHMVIASERTYYTHVGRNSISIYDKRTNRPSKTWNNVRDITDNSNCNDISAAYQCEDSQSLYFTTDHHLFLMDMRCHKSKPKVTQRWTHGMQCVPTYLSICNFEFNKEIICLSSQWCEDMCVVTNYNKRLTQESEICGVMIPYRPPSILNTLTEARQKMFCFDLYNPIDNRLCTAITGNIIIEQGQNYVILQQNSLGDISTHTLYPEHMESFIDDNGVQTLHEWSKSFQSEKKEFEVSSIEDFTKVWKTLKKVPESHIIGGGKLISWFKTKFNEKEIFAAFESEELDSGLLDIWTKKHNESTVNESTLNSNIDYSDSE